MKLAKYAEAVQMDADKMAYRLLWAGRLATLQSICDFNIFWISEISITICTDKTVDFLNEHKKRFKRKINTREFIDMDFILSNFLVDDFEEFMKIYTNYVNKKKIFNNMKNIQT